MNNGKDRSTDRGGGRKRPGADSPPIPVAMLKESCSQAATLCLEDLIEKGGSLPRDRRDPGFGKPCVSMVRGR